MGKSLAQLMREVSSQEFTEWVAYYEVTDWLRKGWPKDGNPEVAFEFARSVEQIARKKHYQKTNRPPTWEPD